MVAAAWLVIVIDADGSRSCRRHSSTQQQQCTHQQLWQEHVSITVGRGSSHCFCGYVESIPRKTSGRAYNQPKPYHAGTYVVHMYAAKPEAAPVKPTV